MEKDYSHSAFKRLVYPLFSFVALILVSGMTYITNRIPALSRLTDFLFMVYLLIIIFLPVVFTLCAIPSVVFSIKAMRNFESKQKLIGNLMIAGIYLAAGFYFIYHILFRVI